MKIIYKNCKPAFKRVNILILAIFVTACGEQAEEFDTELRPVRTMLVGQDKTNGLKTFTGVSRSAQESRLSFKVGGTVTEIPVSVGDSIGAGTVIAKLDPSAFELQQQQAQATVSQSSAAARNARAAYERTRSLYANNNVSLGELESTRASSESASAQLKAASKSLQLAELNLSYTQLTVDADCLVDSIAVAENENVQAGAEVARVNCSNELEIEVAVPESIIGEFNRGKTAEIQFDAISDMRFSGKVIEVGVSANGAGSTFPVTVLVTDSIPLLRAGLAASVSFATSNQSNSNHVVPLAAVVQRVDGTFVYTVTASEPSSDQASAIQEKSKLDQGLVSLREVSLGELQSGGVEVLSGLQLGDRVVTAGVSFLRDGMRVLY